MTSSTTLASVGSCATGRSSPSRRCAGAALLVALAASSSVASGVAAQPVATDGTQAWITKPSFPATDGAPTVARPVLNRGPDLAAGAVSLAHYDFTPNGNVNTRVLLDRYFYYSYATGNQTTVAGDDGIDAPGVGQSYARARRYPAGSPYDLHTFDADGLNLNAVCSQNNTAAGCVQNRIYGGMIRSPVPVVPGTIISARLKFPRSVRAWNSFWTFTGVQYTPGPGGDPYSGYGTAKQLIFGETARNAYHEYDIIDGYSREKAGIAVGHYLNTTYVAKHSLSHVVPPRTIYAAGGPAVNYHPNEGYPFQATAPQGVDLTAGFHTFTMEWLGDGSHRVRVYLDRTMYLEQYWEYTKSTYRDPHTGAVRLLGSNVLLANTPIPTFLSEALRRAIVPNDGTPKGWTLSVQSLDIVRGSIASPASYVTDRNAIP